MSQPSSIHELHHPDYAAVTVASAVPVKLAEGFSRAEGPVWFADHEYLLWSDPSRDEMWRYVPGLGSAVFRAPTGSARGSARDGEGRLVHL